MSNLDNAANRPLIESDPLRGGKRIKVGIEGQAISAILSTSTMRQTQGGDMQFGLPIRPSETFTDSVNKLRVSQPESLIDTDFEYSLQTSKWEGLNLIGNWPSTFAGAGVNLDISSMVGGNQLPNSTVTVVTTSAHGLITGDVVSVQETTNEERTDGTFFITVTNATTFTYVAKGQVTGSVFDVNYTTVQAGGIYDRSIISPSSYLTAGAPVAKTSSSVNITTDIITSNAHTFIQHQEVIYTTSGTPIGGLIAGGRYYIIPTDVNNFRISDNFNCNGFIDLTSAGTGTHTFTPSGSRITVTTVSSAHGLVVGTPITVVASSEAGANGAFYIGEVTAGNRITYATQVSVTTNPTGGSIYVRPEGNFIHRSFDGGVSITTGNQIIGPQAIRQTRRYFRYQSGKGMQMSAGVKFTPTYDVETISAVGNVCTLTTIQDHGLSVGASVIVEGVEVQTGTNRYNGTFVVTFVDTPKTFRFTMAGTPEDLSPGGPNIFVSVRNWTSALTRMGLFDEQNGFFFEYDGTTLWAVRRFSIKEMFGKVNVTSNSEIVTGTNTNFVQQFMPGDYIVIKGMSYRVTGIQSATQLTIAPEYRGTVNLTAVRYVKSQEIRVPQSEWNLDRLNGAGGTTNLSGYNLDITKMQMAYIDYTWYGAGHIRWGFRATNGEVIYVHKMQNNNVNYSAYQRSGNLPARYEVNNFGYYSRMIAGGTTTRGAALTSAQNSLWIQGNSFAGAGTGAIPYIYKDYGINFPTSGLIEVSDGVNTELMSYTGKSAFNTTMLGYQLTGLTRRLVGGTQSSVTFTPDASANGLGTAVVSVRFVRNTCVPLVSHWGTSVIMDGRYDEDRSYLFSIPRANIINVPANQGRPLFSIRIAPSADKGIGRAIGIRDVVNRMQLSLNSVGIYSQGQFLITGVLNPARINGLTLPASWDIIANRIAGGSLAQVLYHTSAHSIVGGEIIFAFYANNAGGTTNFTSTTFVLNEVKELGASILSGNGSATYPCYPNGPDVLTIFATNISATAANITGRISWTEAQA
jgi:hypothetical protein